MSLSQVVRLAVDPVIFGDGRLWVELMGDKNYQASLLRRSPVHGGKCKIIPEELSVCLHIGVQGEVLIRKAGKMAKQSKN